jgi:hypothetical protein
MISAYRNVVEKMEDTRRSWMIRLARTEPLTECVGHASFSRRDRAHQREKARAPAVCEYDESCDRGVHSEIAESNAISKSNGRLVSIFALCRVDVRVIVGACPVAKPPYF